MKMNNLIIAGIVSYNPDIDLLKKNIEALIKVNLNIIIVDNHSSNIMEIREATKSEANILIYELESNRGIANALNSIMNYAFDHNIKWVLTLDQDSIVPCNIIQDNLKCLKESNNIGIISPVILDRNIQIFFQEPYAQTHIYRAYLPGPENLYASHLSGCNLHL